MITRLSEKYSKAIALFLIYVFTFGGIASVKASSGVIDTSTGIKADGRFGRYLFFPPVSAPGLKKQMTEPLHTFPNSDQEIQSLGATVAIPPGKNNEHEEEIKSMFIGGPGQPEMSSFKSVGADNMVSTFTGDFSYNIPLLDVGGYPVNIFYNSGITMDQEASWVGLGWNINPGTINRNLRGLPDDFDGSDIITEKQDMRPDQTWGVSGAAGVKFAGFPLVNHSLRASLGLSYNNKLGLAAEAGVSPALILSMNASDEKTNRLTFGANLQLSSRNGVTTTPSISFSQSRQSGEFGTEASVGVGYNVNSRMGISAMHLNAGVSKSKQINYEAANKQPATRTSTAEMYHHNSQISFLYPTILPSIRNIYTSERYTISLGLGAEFTWLNPHFELMGYFGETKIADEDKVTHHAAYGYLHLQNANSDVNAMLDFNRVNEGAYTPNNPAIAIPVYTYDIFSITGEGTGGTFRAYRNDIGFVRDAQVSTKDHQGSLGLDVGLGNIVHGGAEIGLVFSQTEVNAWQVNNAASSTLKFKENSGSYQAVYFKNPGEKAIVDEKFQEAVGGENLVRFKLSNIKSSSPLLIPVLNKYDPNKNLLGAEELTSSNIIKSSRDKRSQIITFLTAREASRVGFTKKIFSYDPDSDKVIFGSDCEPAGIEEISRTELYRKDHHISEVNILGTDGRRYIYGIPVYNIVEHNIAFAVENGDMQSGKSEYTPGVDDEINLGGSSGNKNGRDWYVKEQITPAYAHSFLLTQLVSADYVDKKGDGISDDDMGDAIQFNYSKYKDYKWRTPVESNTASYNIGLKTDDKDDKASYIYGEREMWLLYSIESKNMIARFIVKNNRKDGRQVQGIHGGTDHSWGMQSLDMIHLYSKADLVKHGSQAKPIKTVQFSYSYQLCKGVPGSTGSENGKLTLTGISITHNGNKKPLRYKFFYPEDNNPEYEYNNNDRWGNFKPASENPAGMLNNDYPYTIQDKNKTDKYASAWTLNKIQIPSGAVINVEYESDDYAYVQNRRAANLYEVIGFGTTKNPNLNDKSISYLYNGTIANDLVYVNLPFPVKGKSALELEKELKARYFEDIKQLYLNLSVFMPSGKNVPGIAGSEMIPVFADIESYGLLDSVSGHPSTTKAWIKVREIENHQTPMVQQALQFLKQQLPFKAYKGYDLSNSSGVKSVILALGSMVRSGKELVLRNDELLIQEKKCREANLPHSFVRLSNPSLQKLGGGLRVKKVTINDNWNKMTGLFESVYGQEYRYIKEELVNDKMATISSGVASWEPSIGGDENPFREIMRFRDHNRGGPYDYGAVTLPIGEAFYPSPLVGYSQVEILSIHRDTVKNKPTRQVIEYYTNREFPFHSTSTSLSDGEANARYEPRPIMQLLQLDMKKSITQSQGFLVHINDMNGKEKRKSIYTESDPFTPVSYMEYHYNINKSTDKTFKFNHVVPTIASAEGKVTSRTIGLDIELMADFRQHTTITRTINTHLNFDLSVFFLPVPISTILRPVISEGTIYRSAALLKIVNHYGILDSTVVVDHGSMVSTRNLIYDAETGNPLLTRTNNEHNRPVYNFTYPAHWAYSGMAPAYKNIDAFYRGLNFSHGQLLNMPADLKNILESGDEIYVYAENNKSIEGIYPCDEDAGSDPWTTLQKSEENKVWALNTGKSSSSDQQWVFLDKDGNPYNAVSANARIIRSGHRNLTDAVVGSTTMLQYPVDASGKLNFDESTQIITSTAATFKDHWKVDNAFYLVDSVVEVKKPVRMKKTSLSPESIMNLLLYFCHSNLFPNGTYALPFLTKDFLMAEKMLWKKDHSKHYVVGFAKYDFSNLPSDATIVSAKLNLVSHGNYEVGSNVTMNHFTTKLKCNSHGLPKHKSFDAHIKGKENSFKLSRVTKEWSSTSTNYFEWLSYLGSSQSNDWEGAVGHHGTSGPFSNESFTTLNNGKYCDDSRIDISVIAKKMFLERNKISPMLKMELIQNEQYKLNIRNTDVLSRLCFNPPVLDIYYYTCNDNLLSKNENFADDLCDPLFDDYFCITSQPRLFCFSKFTEKKSINPYVEGVLGNWRMDTAYVYYGNRKQNNVETDVDLRYGGVIEGFRKFWNFSNDNKGYLGKNYSSRDVWVWNSTITQYNQKGYEVENKDPLGRFNSGLYGYNKQLPTAVVNNARVREILFDGFEDYDYTTNQECVDCKPAPPFRYDNDIMANLDATQSHTGQKSLRVDSWKSISIEAPVTDVQQADGGHSLRVRIDSTQYIDTSVNLKGTGLTGSYLKYNKDCSKRFLSFELGLKPGCVFDKLEKNKYQFQETQGSINFISNDSRYSWPSRLGKKPERFATRWDGYYQANRSGYYYFNIKADDGVMMWFNNKLIIDSWNIQELSSVTARPVFLVKGQVYPMKIYYYNYNGDSQLTLSYKFTNDSRPIRFFTFDPVPASHLYPLDRIRDTDGTVKVETTWCTRADSVNVRGNALTDSFSLIKGKTMVFSAWVKEGGNDCKCSTYTKNSVTISYNNGQFPLTMQPTGNIIEGWQRYENVFSIPPGATSVRITLRNQTSDGPVYFDDLRILPFNANMKSFVYHSSNLRLTSELDENNYATFYEYDDDGTLIRVKKETIEGIKTITETRSAMQREQ